MSISAVSSPTIMPASPGRVQAPAGGNDGDSDDRGTVQAQPVQAAKSAGVGQVVDKSV